MTQAPTIQLFCELEGCRKPFSAPSWAPHKRFCCGAHRAAFHKQEQARALRLLREQAKAHPVTLIADLSLELKP